MERIEPKSMTRDTSIDIIKGMGIILMVAVHGGAPCERFISLFHMAIFVIASGYFFRGGYTDNFHSLLKFIRRKVIGLWCPYVLWAAIYSCLHNFFIRINVYTDNPMLLEYVSGPLNWVERYWTAGDVVNSIATALFLHFHSQMSGAFWFIAMLLALSLAYCVMDYGIKVFLHIADTTKIQLAVSVVFLLLGYACHIMGRRFFGIDTVLSSYILFHGGRLLNQFSFWKARTELQHFVYFLAAFAVLFLCSQTEGIGLGVNSYPDPFFLLAASFAGWQFLYEIAHYSGKIGFLKSALSYIGLNTMPVLILHFLSFKPVSYAGVLSRKEPLFLVAAFPTLYSGGLWWVAYLFSGLAIPLCADYFWKRLKARIFPRVSAQKNAV